MFTSSDTAAIYFTADEVAGMGDFAFISTEQTLNSAFALGFRVILSDPLFFVTAISTMCFLTLLFAMINYFRRGV